MTCIIDSKEHYIDPGFDIKPRTNKIDINKLLSDMVVKDAFDLHLKSPTGPVYHIDRELNKQDCFEVTPQDVEGVFCEIASQAQQTEFYAHNEVDFSYSITDHFIIRASNFLNSSLSSSTSHLLFHLLENDV